MIIKMNFTEFFTNLTNKLNCKCDYKGKYQIWDPKQFRANTNKLMFEYDQLGCCVNGDDQYTCKVCDKIMTKYQRKFREMVSPRDAVAINFLEDLCKILNKICDGGRWGSHWSYEWFTYDLYNLTFDYGINSGCHRYATELVCGSCRSFIELYRNKFKQIFTTLTYEEKIKNLEDENALLWDMVKISKIK